jgi:hypothetical protein
MEQINRIVNKKFGRLLDRFPQTRRLVRDAYKAFNSSSANGFLPFPPKDRAVVGEYFKEPNHRLARQLLALGYPLPSWLSSGGKA